jgi:PAS domain S-box-containing protein
MTAGAASDLRALFRRPPGRAELAALLELVQSPALLVDLRAQRIEAANLPARQLAGLGRAGLDPCPLTRWFPELTPSALLQGLRGGALVWNASLRTRSGRAVPARISLHLLDGGSGYGILALDGRRAPAADDDEMLAQRFAALPLLVRALAQPDRGELSRRLLQAGQLLTGATTLALYELDLTRQSLCRRETWGLEAHLPGKLAVGEADQLRHPVIWTPGARPAGSLHRAFPSSEIRYVASIPVDPQAPFDALLVLADSINPPPRNLESMLEALAAVLAVAGEQAAALRALEFKLLRQSQTMSQSESIQDVVNDALIFVNPSLAVTDLNARAEALLGYTHDEVRGWPLQDVLITPEPLHAALQAMLASPAPADLGNLRLARRDGRMALVHLRLKPYLDGGALLRLAVVLTDLSQLEQSDLRAQQLEQQAQLGELTAILAHEIRNPINNIGAALQVMAMGLPAGDPSLEQIQAMREDLERLEQLMRSVLSFAHARNYQMALLDLTAFLQSLLARHQARAAAAGVELRLQLPESPVFVTADRLALEQVFANLIGNGLEALPDGGVIGIRVAPSPDPGESRLVQIDVSDTGPGIPEDMLERVFDPFFTTKSRGTGLGLAIVKRIVNVHNGWVSIESFAGGTLFRVTLPTRPEPSPA